MEVIIVVVHVGAVKIYVAAVEALPGKRKDGVKTTGPLLYTLCTIAKSSRSKVHTVVHLGGFIMFRCMVQGRVIEY